MFKTINSAMDFKELSIPYRRADFQQRSDVGRHSSHKSPLTCSDDQAAVRTSKKVHLISVAVKETSEEETIHWQEAQ